jgi:hypothetical protein
VQQVLHRVSTVVVARQNRRLVGDHREHLAVCDFLRGAVKSAHPAFVARAVDPGIAGAKMARTQFRVALDRTHGATEHFEVDAVDDVACLATRALLLWFALSHVVAPVLLIEYPAICYRLGVDTWSGIDRQQIRCINA